MNILEEFGNIDIYLFDQLLKGRFLPGMRLLDAGCGKGRNLVYFFRNGFDVFAIDRSEASVEEVRRLAVPWYGDSRAVEQIRQEPVEKMSFANDSFDAVICNAVLHFAEDDRHFRQMVSELWRVLKPGGLLFIRLASSIGLEDRVVPLGGNRFLLPDGSERYLVDEPMLTKLTVKLHGQLVEPLKTVNVAGQRCMTTWCLRKPHILFFDPIEGLEHDLTPPEHDATEQEQEKGER